MKTVYLNVDLGEVPDEPEALYALATVVNVACGGHAGDASTMARAVELALSHGARIAAHPSYPDRAGFGRTSITITRDALVASLQEQIEELAAIVRDKRTQIVAVKPHGALYHDAARSPALAEAVLAAFTSSLPDEVFECGIALVGPPEGALARLAAESGIRYWREGFADRAYDETGRLVPRGQKGALIEDPASAAAQALSLAKSGRFDTLCVHGDTKGAVDIASAVRSALGGAGLLTSRPC